MSIRQGNNTIAGSGCTKSEVDTLLAGKADTALSNITATGKEVIAHNAMPSNHLSSLTLGASGANYTAIRDGYIVLQKKGNAGEYITIDSGYDKVFSSYSYNDQSVLLRMSIRKGATFSIWYNASGTLERFNFIPAVGAN